MENFTHEKLDEKKYFMFNFEVEIRGWINYNL
jgi:hypothetical protein